MFTRVLTSAVAGVAVTSGLLFLMQNLIASGEEIITESGSRGELIFVRVKEKEVVNTARDIPDRIDKPKIPPQIATPRPDGSGDVVIGIPTQQPVQPTGRPGFAGPSLGDGPLISIILVAPQYPRIAASKGLEGTVLVEFDVTETGTVADVVVIESSSKIFNQAAIDAAYRFRYKPGIVDGRPYATKGLRYLFRFEMEK